MEKEKKRIDLTQKKQNGLYPEQIEAIIDSVTSSYSGNRSPSGNEKQYKLIPESAPVRPPPNIYLQMVKDFALSGCTSVRVDYPGHTDSAIYTSLRRVIKENGPTVFRLPSGFLLTVKAVKHHRNVYLVKVDNK